MRISTVISAALASITSATIRYNGKAFDHVSSRRQVSQNSSALDLVVDLGYEQYRGVANASTKLNTWKGVRYAASPTNALRWQPPTAPTVNRYTILSGDKLPERCPQSYRSPAPPDFNYTGNEDCLFLSVYAPQNASNLPVLVWIHGGGYGQGQGDQDMSSIINTNNNNFVGVAIQYRVSDRIWTRFFG